MKKICPVCEKEKARRRCPRHGNAEICSVCCATTRDAECGDCPHYAEARKYQVERRSAAPPEGHFTIEISPEIEKAVNDALADGQAGRIDQATKVIDRLNREHPGNHSVCFGMGTLLAMQERDEESIGWFDQAIKIYPYFVEAHYNRAVACKNLLDISGAIVSYRNVIKYGASDDPEVREARKIITKLDAAVRKSDGIGLDDYLSAIGEFNRAFEFMQRDEWESAVKGFQAAIAINKRNAPSYGNLGICYIYLGHKALALAALDRALELDPEYEPARGNRLLAAKMEEGRAPENTVSRTIEFGKEQMQGKAL
jgi:tetratricopeptide (TPR) repeat protein